MSESSNSEFSDEQRSGLDGREADQDRTLAAVHHLEATLSAAAPGRESNWRDAVLGALSSLEQATLEEANNADRPDSLLSDLARTQPRLRNRARALRLQYRQLLETIGSLRQEVQEVPDVDIDYEDLRQRVSWPLIALRHQRARESDLIYEAYYEAFKVDLRAEADPGSASP
jgi:hypothetical protein